MSKDRSLYVLFFVDDILLLYRKEDQAIADSFIERIKKSYELRSMGTGEWFLGIRIVRNRTEKTIALVHDTYLEKIVKKFKQYEGPIPTTLLPFGDLLPHDGQASKGEIKFFQEKVGSILYSATMIRPDIAFACSLLSRFLTNPSL